MREYSGFLKSGKPLSQDLFAEKSSGRLPFSYTGRTGLLLRCADGLNVLTLQLLPRRDQDILAENCYDLAQRVLDTNSGFSLAYYTQAVAAQKMDDLVKLQNALVLAQSTAPREGWLADRRMRLALANYEHLSVAARYALHEDIVLLLEEWKLRHIVVAQYLQDPSLRNLLVSIAQTQSDDIQRKFLVETKKELGL